MLEITKEMETGIPEVDEQHRELVSKVNNLIALKEKGITEEETKKTLDFLAEYAVMHFKTEEDLMTRCVYPACYLHEGQHKFFVDKFLAFKHRFENEGHSDVLSTELNTFLVSWLINHIKVSDMDFGRHYIKSMSQLSLEETIAD